MFSNISWSNYFIMVALLSAAYYLVIGYLYYRDDLLQLFSGKKITTDNVIASTQRYQSSVQSFADEAHAFLHEAGRNKLGKEDILQSFQLLLKRYPALKDLAFRESIQGLIINDCKSYCSIHL